MGSTESIKIDIRLISATNKNLHELIRMGRFREDLFYRLNVIEINMPPLRARSGDILILAAHFLNRFNINLKKDIKGFAVEAITALENYSWPGNIRELENVIERAVVLCKSNEIGVSDLPAHIATADKGNDQYITSDILPYKELRKRVIENFERNYFSRLLERTGGNISKASRIAGVDRSNLRKLIIRYPDIYGRFK